MAGSFTVPTWVILLICLSMYSLTLYVKSRRSKRGLAKHDVWVSVGESIGPANALYLFIYILCLLVIGEQNILSILAEQPFPIAIIALYLVALVLDFILKNWKAWKKTR